MDFDLNKVRKIQEQAEREAEARKPRALSDIEVVELVSKRLPDYKKLVEEAAAKGGRAAYIRLQHESLQSAILGPFYLQGDFLCAQKGLGWYSKRYLAYYSDPGHLIPEAKKYYDEVSRYFTNLGFSVCIQFYGHPSSDDPSKPCICISW